MEGAFSKVYDGVPVPVSRRFAMVRHPYPWLSALIVLPAACSNGGEPNRAVSGQNAAAPENRAAAAAPAASESNAAAQRSGEASGVCPFETRNWRVTLDKSMAPGGGRQITIRGEINGDAQGRSPQLTQQLPQPPEIVLDVDADPMATPQPPMGWGETGIGYDYDSAYTHAVVRCAGREIARIPIPRG
jgi:hypothetical protein